jgi:hypothetical protein
LIKSGKCPKANRYIPQIGESISPVQGVSITGICTLDHFQQISINNIQANIDYSGAKWTTSLKMVVASIWLIMPLRTRYNLWHWGGKTYLQVPTLEQRGLPWCFLFSLLARRTMSLYVDDGSLNLIGNHPINKLSDLLPGNFQKL